MQPEQMQLDVNVSLYGQQGSRLSINESVSMGQLSFAQLAKLLEAFHIIAEAVKQGRTIEINGQPIRYFQ